MRSRHSGLHVAGDRHEARGVGVHAADVEHVGGVVLGDHRRERHELGALEPLVQVIVGVASRRIGEDRARAERARAVFHAAGVDRADLARRRGVRTAPSTGLAGAAARPASLQDARSMRVGVIAAEIDVAERMAVVEPGRRPSRCSRQASTPPTAQTFVAHRRENEQLVERQRLGQEPVELDVGEDAAGEAEVAARMARQQPRKRQQHTPRAPSAPKPPRPRAARPWRPRRMSTRMSRGRRRSREWIRPPSSTENAPRCRRAQDRLAHGGEPGHLAFVAVGRKPAPWWRSRRQLPRLSSGGRHDNAVVAAEQRRRARRGEVTIAVAAPCRRRRRRWRGRRRSTGCRTGSAARAPRDDCRNR